MNELETRVNNYINNELLNFNNIETNPLEGKDLKDIESRYGKDSEVYNKCHELIDYLKTMELK